MEVEFKKFNFHGVDIPVGVPEEEVQRAVEEYISTHPVGGFDYTKMSIRGSGSGSSQTYELVYDEHVIGSWTVVTPQRLPNPTALTFTGAVDATYDGSMPVEVNIPSGGGGDFDASKLSVTSQDIPQQGTHKNSFKYNGVQWGETTSKIPPTTAQINQLIDAKIPTALPNPNKLTLTGAVNAEYDGSSAVSVNIPSGGGGDSAVWQLAATFDTSSLPEDGSTTHIEVESNIKITDDKKVLLAYLPTGTALFPSGGSIAILTALNPSSVDNYRSYRLYTNASLSAWAGGYALFEKLPQLPHHGISTATANFGGNTFVTPLWSTALQTNGGFMIDRSAGMTPAGIFYLFVR